MKRIVTILTGFFICGKIFADIAPSPIVVKGIYTLDSCKIQMISEYVFADLYNDSAKVECTFELLNYRDSTTIQIGFPEMNFQNWSLGQYNEDDRKTFRISVNGRILTENEIGVPEELDSIYNAYMYVYFIENEYVRKADSIYKANNVIVKDNGTYIYPSTQSNQETAKALDILYQWRESKPYLSSDLWDEFKKQMKKRNFPWYVWNVHFDKNERKVIKVTYSLPSGEGYGTAYRYFKYILETGSGWYKEIENAHIKLQLHDIDPETIEEITPNAYNNDKINNTIEWNLVNIEPTPNDDIYVKYYNPEERLKFEKYQKKRERAIRVRKLNPVNWFR